MYTILTVIWIISQWDELTSPREKYKHMAADGTGLLTYRPGALPSSKPTQLLQQKYWRRMIIKNSIFFEHLIKVQKKNMNSTSGVSELH